MFRFNTDEPERHSEVEHHHVASTSFEGSHGGYRDVAQQIFEIVTARPKPDKMKTVRAGSLHSDTTRTIQICSASQAALLVIESSKVKSRLILQCKKTLNDLDSRNRVILTRVPGHSGVLGNEEGDRLAREGSAMYIIVPEPILEAPSQWGTWP
ncbi:hypothetical protein NQ317_002038 [Molorchus minor]|uniref:RNase H type-1 domain-containing protein n=1 Tax=Molorchus minor TaxID=1323400 RepID=A0ABQ9JKS9_9CUCU|nr:hypothetical protein NQ317_002038 [Molorchus minor]